MSSDPVVFGDPVDFREWVKCANEIMARIADGRYPPGQWLPGVAEMAKEFGAHASSVYRGLAEVKRNGHVSQVKRIGYYTGQEPPAKHPPWRQRQETRKPPRADELTGMLAEEYITVAELATSLRVASSTVYRAIQSGDIEGIKIGAVIRIPVSQAEAYLKSCAITGQIDFSQFTEETGGGNDPLVPPAEDAR